MRLYGWVYKFSLPAGIVWVTGRRCPLSRLRGLCSLQHNLVQGSHLVWGSCSFCCLLPPKPRVSQPPAFSLSALHPLTPGSQLAGLWGGGGRTGGCQLTTTPHLSLGQSPAADLGINKFTGDGRQTGKTWFMNVSALQNPFSQTEHPHRCRCAAATGFTILQEAGSCFSPDVLMEINSR